MGVRIIFIYYLVDTGSVVYIRNSFILWFVVLGWPALWPRSFMDTKTSHYIILYLKSSIKKG